MTTNETICKWLGFEKNIATIEEYYWRVDENGIDDMIKPDFLHDRNQQKWIEDKLENEGYLITYTLTDVFHYSGVKRIWKIVIVGEPHSDIIKSNESKDLAFIQAVEQLIDK